MKFKDAKDLIQHYQLVRIQEEELEKKVKELMLLQFRLSARANNLRDEYKMITGDWLDKEGNIVKLNKPITEFS